MNLEQIKLLDHNQRLETLEANAYSIETKEIPVYFSDEEMASMKSSIAESVIQKLKLEDELKELSKELRAKIKTQSQNLIIESRFVKDGFEMQKQKVYNFDDQENNTMLTYDGNGELLTTRKLSPSEKQTKTFSINPKLD